MLIAGEDVFWCCFLLLLYCSFELSINDYLSVCWWWVTCLNSKLPGIPSHFWIYFGPECWQFSRWNYGWVCPYVVTYNRYKICEIKVFQGMSRCTLWGRGQETKFYDSLLIQDWRLITQKYLCLKKFQLEQSKRKKVLLWKMWLLL